MRTRRWCVLLGLTFGVCLAGPAASALGAVPNGELVFAQSAASSANKSVSVSCPAGKKVVGAGGSVGLAGSPADGQVLVEGLVPNASLTAVTAEGVEDQNGYAGNWEVFAYAVCAVAPGGLTRVVATSAASSANKGHTASCPAGKRLVGTGGEINGGAGQVVMSAVRPNPGLTAVEVAGVEDETGFAGSWSVTSYAICATAPAGLELVSTTTPPGSAERQFPFADCPAGKRVVGTGGAVNGGAGQVGMDVIQPANFDLRSAVAFGHEDETGFAGNWSATAYAICADSAQLVVNRSATGSPGAQGRDAGCPAGSRLTGAGGDIGGGAGQVALIAIRPWIIDNTVQPSNVFVIGVEDQDGFAGNWFARAFAICATPPPGLERQGLTWLPDTGPSKDATAVCPTGKKLIGAGGEITDGGGQVVMTAIRPNASLTSVTVHAEEDDDLYAFDWSVTAYAICATPPPGLQLVSAASEFDPDTGSAVASCPAGKHLLGAGAAISAGLGNDGAGNLMLDDLRPHASLTKVTATGLVDQDGYGLDWNVTAHAICARM